MPADQPSGMPEELRHEAGAGGLWVRLLGPIDVWTGGVSRPVQGLRRTAVLAALALQPGEIVSTDRLIDVVWGDEAPATAAATLQSNVSYLRRVLGGRATILARSPGYMLDIGEEATDVQVAQQLIREGSQSAEPDHRQSRLAAAVALWRGRPLADLAGLAWFDGHADRLEQLLLQARQALIDTRLSLGEHTHLIPELESLSRQHPLHEHIHGQLMLALYRAGRQGEALAVYQRLRRTLDDDLGIDPSQPLRDLETAILRQDPALHASPAAPPAPQAVGGTRPAQLPPAMAAFSGRRRELAHLDGLLPAADGDGGPPPAAVVIAAITGAAGIGKTALAVHWAHRIAARFPDGQLYVNLRGSDAAGRVMDPAEAVRGFLDALGVPAQRIPAGLDAQTALYRSLLDAKRVLVVLDNARDVEQVRPLLPGTPGCLAVVTSRNQLTGLVATEGAQPLALDLLTPAEARDLLSRRLGGDRLAGEPEAVDEIIARSARLPLALANAAARAAAGRGLSLAAIAGQLQDAGAVLDRRQEGGPGTDIESALLAGERALLVDGDLDAGRRWFGAAWRDAEAQGDGPAMARAALGLGGLWVHQNRTAVDAAMVRTRQRQVLSLIDPRSSLAFRLRARLAAEEDFRSGGHQAIVALVAQARQRGDAVSLAEALSLAHQCVRGPGDGAQRLELAQELIGVASLTNRRVDLLIGLLWQTLDLFVAADPHAERTLAELRGLLARKHHHAVGFLVGAVDVMLCIRSGRLDEAEALAAECARRGTAIGDSTAAARYASHMAAIRWYQGRVSELVPLLSQQVHSPTLSATDNSFFAVLAAAAATAGDRDQAATMLARLRGRDLAHLPRSNSWLVTLYGAVEAAALLDDADTASQAYALLAPFAHLPVTGGVGVPCMGSVQHSLGVASLTTGHLDRAVEHLRAAVHDNQVLGHVPATALSRARLEQALALSRA